MSSAFPYHHPMIYSTVYFYIKWNQIIIVCFGWMNAYIGPTMLDPTQFFTWNYFIILWYGWMFPYGHLCLKSIDLVDMLSILILANIFTLSKLWSFYRLNGPCKLHVGVDIGVANSAASKLVVLAINAVVAMAESSNGVASAHVWWNGVSGSIDCDKWCGKSCGNNQLVAMMDMASALATLQHKEWAMTMAAASRPV